MADLLLELLSEEIPARMQERAAADLARLFADEIAKAGLVAERIETLVTPRRLTLIARGLPTETQPVADERKGPRADAPDQAIAGFLKSTGLTRDQLVERADAKGVVTLFAVVDRPGRATADVIADAVPAVVRAFPWPKSLRWGEASASTESLRWVRPLQGIVALLGNDVVPFSIDGVASGAETVGHRFHHPGRITIGNADDYAAKLHACHVIVDPAERRRIIAEGAAEAARAAGLTLVDDPGLIAENAGLTEWPMPLLGSFDPAFLDVPREVIQLTMRTNQKYFACTDADGKLAPNFVCTANIDAVDGGKLIVAGNEKVLAARLSDAKFFWDQDLKVPLEKHAEKLSHIVFHEKLGTVADKAERVAKLARWLVEQDIIKPLPSKGGVGAGDSNGQPHPEPTPNPSLGRGGLSLADQAELAAKLCKADLVTGMVGEFPELQGVIGGYYARAQGLPDAVADAIRDHYKPVGQGDEVPTAPVTVAVSLADKLDTLASFYVFGEKPTGSKDPFALRRAALGANTIILSNALRIKLAFILTFAATQSYARSSGKMQRTLVEKADVALSKAGISVPGGLASAYKNELLIPSLQNQDFIDSEIDKINASQVDLLAFLADRLKVQQREAGVRHDLIDAVFALGGEDDLVRLLARVHALQSFVATEDGANLLAGYKRAANILKKEGVSSPSPRQGEGRGEGESGETALGSELPLSQPSPQGGEDLPAETALRAALDAAEPRADAAIAAEDFEGAMAALATLRAPIDSFFDTVIVNDPDPAKRAARLGLLTRVRDAVHRVADFSKIEG